MSETTTNGADPIVTAEGNNLHYYRPIASFAGRVMKYAGMASTNNLAYFPQECMEEADGYLPGLLILPVHAGDRILTSNLTPFVE
jgi:hypothetical protein